ncbi:MAG: Fic family protein [Coriobacteriia bacterium]|nr:Fic family protein [Coriobacteriia bacterium]
MSEWTPIADLPVDWPNLTSPELTALGDLWAEQREKLKDSDALRDFNEKLRRSWAIETGIIEHLYTLDRGITQLLVEHGLEASLVPHGASDMEPEALVRVLQDQAEALDGVMDLVASGRQLSVSFIKELHQLLTRNQPTTTALVRIEGHSESFCEVPLLRGEWKQQPNNPTRPDGVVHMYCPPIQVESEMDRLIKMHAQHAEAGVSPEVSAAWLHHRFTQVHPFQDGNGRIARALASLVLLKAGWFPLVIDRQTRENYIGALETADSGDLGPLVGLFVKIEKRAFMKAVSLSHEVQAGRESVQNVIGAALDRLRRKSPSVRMRGVFETAHRLEAQTVERLHDLSGDLDRELDTIDRSYYANNDASTDSTDYYFKLQIVRLANEFDYFANTSEYRTWMRMRIHTDRHTDFVVSFHGLGYEFMGILAATAFIEYRDKNAEGETQFDGPHAVCAEPFQFAYNEDTDGVVERYSHWLNDALVLGLDIWRRQL